MECETKLSKGWCCTYVRPLQALVREEVNGALVALRADIGRLMMEGMATTANELLAQGPRAYMWKTLAAFGYRQRSLLQAASGALLHGYLSSRGFDPLRVIMFPADCPPWVDDAGPAMEEEGPGPHLQVEVLQDSWPAAGTFGTGGLGLGTGDNGRCCTLWAQGLPVAYLHHLLSTNALLPLQPSFPLISTPPTTEFLHIDFNDAELVVRSISRRSAGAGFAVDRERPMHLDYTSWQVCFNLEAGSLDIFLTESVVTCAFISL